jgi:FkbM family methyltransferase
MFKNIIDIIQTFIVLGIWPSLILYLKLIFVKRNLIKLKPREIRYPIFVRQNSTDLLVFQQIFIYKEYLINYNNSNPKTIIDAGANIGLSAIFFANKYPDSIIYAIEPEENNFKILLKNINPYRNIIAIKAAIWHQIEPIEINTSTLGEWAFTISPSINENRNKIKVVTIAEIINNYSLGVIDILKIDIEGSEKKLFKHGHELWLPKVSCIIIEVHDWIVEGCSETLFKALSNYKFQFSIRGENLIFQNIKTNH